MSDIVERLTEAADMRDELKERYWHRASSLKREAADEITRLRQLLSEAKTREYQARRVAIEQAALCVDAKVNIHQIEAKDVRRSYQDRRFNASVADRLREASADIRALQSEER